MKHTLKRKAWAGRLLAALTIFLITHCIHQYACKQMTAYQQMAYRTPNGATNYTQGPITVLLTILTHPANTEKRMAQRTTWIRDLPIGFKYAYIVGNLTSAGMTEHQAGVFKKEQEEYRDILEFPDLNEEYREIAEKVYRAFKWSVGGLSEGRVLPAYVAKTDDDTCVAPRNLAEVINSWPKPTPKMYWGNTVTGGLAIRDKESKYHISEAEYPAKLYPPFNCGAFYLVSVELAKALAVHYDSPSYRRFPLEDVGMGIFMADAGIQPTDSGGAVQCDGPAQEEMVALHYSMPKSMKEDYEVMQTKFEA